MTPSVETWLATKELLALVRTDLAKLSKNEQKLILEAFVEVRPREDMARELGWTTLRLNVNIHRALKKLRHLVFPHVS